MCGGSDNGACPWLLGREFNLKFSVNPKEPTNLSELVKTRDRERLFWAAPMNASMGLFMAYLHFFLSVSVMLTNVGMIALSGMTLSEKKDLTKIF